MKPVSRVQGISVSGRKVAGHKLESAGAGVQRRSRRNSNDKAGDERRLWTGGSFGLPLALPGTGGGERVAHHQHRPCARPVSVRGHHPRRPHQCATAVSARLVGPVRPDQGHVIRGSRSHVAVRPQLSPFRVLPCPRSRRLLERSARIRWCTALASLSPSGHFRRFPRNWAVPWKLLRQLLLQLLRFRRVPAESTAAPSTTCHTGYPFPTSSSNPLAALA